MAKQGMMEAVICGTGNADVKTVHQTGCDVASEISVLGGVYSRLPGDKKYGLLKMGISM